MGKKDKNSLLDIHYSRTLTSDNLSKAANYVGEYVLNGLGTLGRFLNAGFTSPTYGTTGQVSYARNAEDAKRLRKQSEASEQAMGKAMTWVSPLNYGAAILNGHGLDARKGEEEVASWSPAWQAVGRLGELYVGPKAVKGVKSAPKTVVNTAAKAGIKPAKTAVVAREINNVTKKGILSLKKLQPEIRTRYGDVEIDNPELAYRLVGKGAVENFLKTGELFVPVKLTGNKLRDALNNMMGGTPMYKQGSLWYGLDPINYPELFTTAEPLAIGNKHATIVKPWIDPGKVIKKGIRTGEVDYVGRANLLGGRRVPFTEDLLNLSNVTSYKWVPGYGYKKVIQEPSTSLAFFERKPAKNNIVGASYDYRMEDPKGSMDFLKQFFALLKINGKEYTLEGLRDAANVQQGLPEHIQSYLNLNTVERAVRAMRKNGYSEREIQLYIDKVNEEMNKVKVGMYSDLEYNAAGALDFGGFYNNESNFISVNRDAHLKDSKFTPEYIMKHEGRHLIDYNTSMTDDVINILEKAYDKDFLEIPKHEDAGSLKDYQHMDRERVTTNRDARDVLLSNLEKHLGEFLNLTKFAQTSFGKNKDMVDFLNGLILYAEPEDIINAVENSNGYGKRYINYLRKNNKLTSAKIEQLRLAMIHVPSYLLPIAGGYTLYNLFNQPLQQLQYQKQGGKMNIIKQFKNGGLIRKMQTAAGGPILFKHEAESTRVEKPKIINSKEVTTNELANEPWYVADLKKLNTYPNLKDDKYILEFYEYDYAPRFWRLNGKASENYVDLASNIYKNTPITLFHANNGTGGYHVGGLKYDYNNPISKWTGKSDVKSAIYLNNRFKISRPVLVHELAHAFRLGTLGTSGDPFFNSDKVTLKGGFGNTIGYRYNGSGYSNRESDLLNRAYNMEGFLTANPFHEKGTTNTEVRFRLWKELYNKLGRVPTLNETDDYIRNYNGQSLQLMIRDANAYGEKMYENGMKNNQVKDALINVAQNDYKNNDLISYAKNGIKLLKKGSGIHIKKENRGKFTSYCGGKVTDECIRKAKASGNPTLVKRATFAANARKWKHKNGGKAFIEGVNVLDSNPKMSKTASRKVKKADDGTKLNAFLKGKFLNSDTVKAIGSTLMNGLSAGFLAKQMNDAINEYELASKARLKKLLSVPSKEYYNKALLTMNPDENLSLIVLSKRAYDIGQQEAQKLYNEEKDNVDQLLNYMKQYANQQTVNNFSGIFLGFGLLAGLLNNKPTTNKVNNGAPVTTGNSYLDAMLFLKQNNIV